VSVALVDDTLATVTPEGMAGGDALPEDTGVPVEDAGWVAVAGFVVVVVVFPVVELVFPLLTEDGSETLIVGAAPSYVTPELSDDAERPVSTEFRLVPSPVPVPVSPDVVVLLAACLFWYHR